jgi:O-antigen/teichoic acid export membrane protein
MLVLLMSYPLYLHYLGYEKYGLWLILAVVLGFAQLGNLGINQAVMKLVAEEYGRENFQGIRSYVTMAWSVLTVTGSMILLIIILFKSQIVAAFKLSGENAILVSWLLPYVGALTIYIFLVQSLNATLAGLGRMDLSNYILTTGQFCAALISISLLWSGRGIGGLLVGNATSFAVIHISSILLIRKQLHKLRFLQRDNWDWQRLKKLISFGSAVFGGTLISILMDPFNKIMLSRYAGVATIPVYDIAYRGSMQVRGLMEAGIRAIMPEISRVGANMTTQARNRISQLNSRSMKLIFFFGIPVYGILAIFAPLLLRVWLRDRFIEILPSVFRTMLLGAFLSLLGVPAFHTMMGLGRVRSCFWGFAITSIINLFFVITIVMLLKSISPQYVAYSVVISIAGSTTYLIWQLRRISIHTSNLFSLARNSLAALFNFNFRDY